MEKDHKEATVETENLVKPLNEKSSGGIASSLRTALVVVAIAIAGIMSGLAVARYTGGANLSGLKSSETAQQTGIAVGDIVGVQNEKTFRDQAEGVLVEGGIDGEGSHHLLRVGGKDKTAYLTSSVVDLNLFVGDRIEVWGETFSAQKAGWLMDVGRVKVLELNAKPPFEE